VQKYAHTFENEMNEPGFLQNTLGPERVLLTTKALRAWYLANARDLPWRSEPSLYGTWISEIMLQQTRVETGVPKWHAFREAFPAVADLARASEDEVLKAWEGLGYYRRARLLHRAAKAIHEAGDFPSTHAEWLELPGIGPYTAAAIASIGLRETVAAVDGNVQRVVARWAGIAEAVDSKAGALAVQHVADALLDRQHPGDHNQAVMELGALVCTPRAAHCTACPLEATCASAGREDVWRSLPVKQPKKKPVPWELHWHVVTCGEWVVVVQRPDNGVWPKMWTFPEIPPPGHFASVGLLLEPVKHILSHRLISASFHGWQAGDQASLRAYANASDAHVMTWRELSALARPRLLTKKWEEVYAALTASERM
jgi:A/G-specific adenine glycosylase